MKQMLLITRMLESLIYSFTTGILEIYIYGNHSSFISNAVQLLGTEMKLILISS